MRIAYPTDISHDRIAGGLIGDTESELLHWIARRLPSSVTPDRLTGLGFAGSVVTALSLLATAWSPAFLWLAIAGLAINWLGDSLDGTVARLRRIERPRYGFFLDYITDLGSQVLIVSGLGASQYMQLEAASAALVGYLILSVYSLAKLQVTRSKQIVFLGVGPTEIRLVVAAGLVVAFFTGAPAYETPFGLLTAFDAIGWLIGLFAVLAAGLTFHRDLAMLAEIDPPHQGVPAEVEVIELKGRRARG